MLADFKFMIAILLQLQRVIFGEELCQALLHRYGDMYIELQYSRTCVIHTANGLLTATCPGPGAEWNVVYNGDFHTDLPTKLEALEYMPPFHMNEALICLRTEWMRKFTKLKRLVIRSLRPMHYYWDKSDAKTPLNVNHYEHMFSELNLDYMEISYYRMKETWKMELPKKLHTLILDHNEYSSLDIHWCSRLEYLSVDVNNLANLPKFSVPYPPLKRLSLKKNPLADMKAYDLVPFCGLVTLELDFNIPLFTAKDFTQNYCECSTLKIWAKAVLVSGVDHIQCNSTDEKPQCPGESKILEDVREIRAKANCPLLSSTLAKPITSILLYVFFFILLLLLLIVIILYIIRHYHLKEWLREHEFHILHHGAPPAQPKVEEEEDEDGYNNSQQIPPDETVIEPY